MVWNWAEAHLSINHLPVFGMVFGLVLLLYAMARQSPEMIRAALILFVLTALGTIPVYMTGDPASHLVRGMAEVDQPKIRQHSDWATWALIAIEAVGLASLAALWLSRRSDKAPASLVRGTLLLAAIAFAMVAWTAHLGGQISHPETRPGFIPPPRVSRTTKD